MPRCNCGNTRYCICSLKKSLSNPTDMTQSKRHRVYQKCDGCCWYCGKSIRIEDFAMDHHIPRSRGGIDARSNRVPACHDCDDEKSNMMPEEYRRFVTLKRLGAPPMTDAQTTWIVGYLEEHGIRFPSIKLIKFYGETI